MSAPAYGSLLLFAIAAVFHLVSCFWKDAKYADLSKPLLMPLLALTAVLSLIPAAAPVSTVVLVTLALIAATAGDVLLLDASKWRFIAGTICFFAGHVFYLCLFAPAIAHIAPWSWAIFIPVALAFTYASWTTINKPTGISGIFIVVYTLILCTMVYSGVAGIISHYTAGSLFVLLGSLLFIASDGILSLTLFKKDFYPSRFVIMATYIAAEALLVYGACCQYC